MLIFIHTSGDRNISCFLVLAVVSSTTGHTTVQCLSMLTRRGFYFFLVTLPEGWLLDPKAAQSLSSTVSIPTRRAVSLFLPHPRQHFLPLSINGGFSVPPCPAAVSK